MVHFEPRPEGVCFLLGAGPLYDWRVDKRPGDFLIAAEDLPDDPERGDVILHAGLRYEVLAPNGEPVWRWSGTGRILRRIHTKEIGGA